jgi:(1->4)-alpha-D-glucan 1-alpha-D-glucosylmutase
MKERQSNWPHTLSATTTHDTKRSEDVRARLNVLSEIPAEWGKALRKWHLLNLAHKLQLPRGRQFPDKNEEYLLYQTLVGTWPLRQADHAGYVQRIQGFMQKAIREAKVNSSWIRPNKQYEDSTMEFVRKILDPELGAGFLKDFEAFQQTILPAGLNNALCQALIKITAPGIPDFYQGSELWDFRLVDPDNRGTVDYQQRQNLLTSLQKLAAEKDPADLAAELKSSISDGRLKLFVIHKALALRNRYPMLFSDGSYLAVRSEGNRRRNAMAFLRMRGEEAVLTATGRFFMEFASTPVGESWEDGHFDLPDFAHNWSWRDIYTNQRFENLSQLAFKQLFAHFPFACLERVIR